MSKACVHCNEQRLVWDGDFYARDFGFDEDGSVSVYHCMSCGARYEIFVPDGTPKPTRHQLEWLMEQLIKKCDNQPTYNDVQTVIKEFAPRFIRWSELRNDPSGWVEALEE